MKTTNTIEPTAKSSRQSNARPAEASGTFLIGGDIPVRRLGFGTMQLTGSGVWGEPADHTEAIAVLRRAVELGIAFGGRWQSPPAASHENRSVTTTQDRPESSDGRSNRRVGRSPARGQDPPYRIV
jgi:hypothetical protein